MCMNFVLGGVCYATGGKCLLGSNGSSAKNSDGECELHGGFDIWITHDNRLLISDMGFPSLEPKQCLALGINQALARRIAVDKSPQLGTTVLTTQRRCFRCARLYWISEHQDYSGSVQVGRAYFCPNCMAEKIDEVTAKRLGTLRYWCG